ncbi:MAG TPA: glycosyltransferase [Streptosporangiaceae bacterium]|nr:glycosyltransferase [Streptosporangiaceae bacterium]
MKIALVALQADALGAGDGTEPESRAGQLSSLVTALTRFNHQVTVYARRDSAAVPGTSTLAPGVIVERVPAGPPERVPADKLASHAGAFGAYLARRWEDNAPDIAHAHFWTSGLAALAAARDLRVPVVQTFHSLQAAGSADKAAAAGMQAAGRQAPGRQAAGTARLHLEPMIARKVRAVLASSSTEMSALTRLGVPRSSLRLIPRGVDTGKFCPDGPVAPRGSRPRLLCVSPLAPGQGLETVLCALADIPGAELVIAGGPERERLRGNRVYRSLVRLAKDVGVRRRVTFHGAVSDGELPALLRSADLFVDVPQSEPFSTFALEAMACGTPVVASAVGSHPDTVVDGTTGILVPPASPVTLAKKVRELLASPMLLDGFGIAAADRAAARYSWERIVQETLDMYERSLQGGASTRAGSADLAAAL